MCFLRLKYFCFPEIITYLKRTKRFFTTSLKNTFLYKHHREKIINYFRYICNDPTKKLIDTTNPQSPLYNSIDATCMVNGKYNIDVTNFGCIGKKINVIVKLK